MLLLCSVLSRTYYAQSNAGIIRAGLTACMRRRLGRPDTYSLTILATSLRKAINNRNTKLMVETKTSPYMHDIELHLTKKKKGHKQEIKEISIEIKRM